VNFGGFVVGSSTYPPYNDIVFSQPPGYPYRMQAGIGGSSGRGAKEEGPPPTGRSFV